MYHDLCSLILFQPESDSLLSKLSELIEQVKQGEHGPETVRQVNGQVRRLLELAGELGLTGNLWHGYLTWFLLTHENPYTLGRERAEDGADSLSRFARQDFAVFRRLFAYDFADVETALGLTCFSELTQYTGPEKADGMGRRILDVMRGLEQAETDEAFYQVLSACYEQFGVGTLGLCSAFRLDTSGGIVTLKPVADPGNIHLDDLVGYESQKQELRNNTLAFLDGKPANNVLLYGDSGSGKSTSVKALIREYYPRGLRLIQIFKHQFQYLSDVVAMVKDRNYKSILFIDDLSFEEFEVEYKFLKAVIEGGVEARPDNVLIYATSNRRHLIRETWDDKADMIHDNDVHRSDTVEEKLSLAGRFGVSIHFAAPSVKEYRRIVQVLAQRAGIEMDEKEMMVRADAWEITHGGATGRAAQQFVNYLLCQDEAR